MCTLEIKNYREFKLLIDAITTEMSLQKERLAEFEEIADRIDGASECAERCKDRVLAYEGMLKRLEDSAWKTIK